MQASVCHASPCLTLRIESEVPQMFDNSAKLDQINSNLTGFFQDIVKFIQSVWKYIEKFFTKDATDPLYEGQVEETEGE